MRPNQTVVGFQARKATPDDADSIAHVHVDTWRTTYKGIVPDERLANLSYERSKKMWEDILSDQKQATFVAEDEDGQVVGFAGCGPARDSEKEYTGELYGIYVKRSTQGKGLGTMLCREVARSLRSRALDSMLVWVLAENPFRRFYERLGGRRVREKEVVIGGKALTEWAYGWKSLDFLVEESKAPDGS